VSQEECEILRESVPYVKLYRYNPKHLYPKLNGYGDGTPCIKGTLEELAAITHQIGLQMNDTKTKYMINRHDGNKVKATELMGKEIRKSRIF